MSTTKKCVIERERRKIPNRARGKRNGTEEENGKVAGGALRELAKGYTLYEKKTIVEYDSDGVKLRSKTEKSYRQIGPDFKAVERLLGKNEVGTVIQIISEVPRPEPQDAAP